MLYCAAFARHVFLSRVAVTHHHSIFAETTRCRRHPIGGLRPPMPIFMSSMQLSLPGSSCGAIRRIGATTRGRPASKVHASTRSPFAGGCGFPFDPGQQADNAPLVWLPSCSCGRSPLPAPGPFRLRAPCTLTPLFLRPASDGEHWVVSSPQGRTPLLLIGGYDDCDARRRGHPARSQFCRTRRCCAALLAGFDRRPLHRSADGLTPSRRQRLVLALRALDAHLAGETYRTIAQGLFGEAAFHPDVLEDTRPP